MSAVRPISSGIRDNHSRGSVGVHADGQVRLSFTQSKTILNLFRELALGKPEPYAVLGRQELFTRQSPQRLKVLREHAVIESAVASNRIEGVEIDRRRVGTVVFGKSHLQDRNEQEVRGYQAALSLIHERHDSLPVSPEAVRRSVASFQAAFHITELHRRCPEVSLDMIRKVLREMRQAGDVECTGRGKHALWRSIRNG